MSMVSPNTMLEAAKEHMLDGRSPKTEEDWALVFNFFAANIHHEVAESACQVLAKIYDVPLSREYIKEIVDFQLGV